MRLAISGDWHYTEKQPGSRRDDLSAAFFDKLTQIYFIAEGFNADALIQPGDLFDSHRANDFTKSRLIAFLRTRELENVQLVSLFGQHDLRYHQSDVLNTPLNLIESTGNLLLIHGINNPLTWNKVIFYGASWFEDIPEPADDDRFKVLVLHKMIVDEKIWEGQEDFVYHNLLLKKHNKFDLIISGDNHKTFTATSGKRHLINAGCLLRTRIDQADHRPCVFLFDTETQEFKQEFLKVDPFDKVIRYEEALKKKKENEKLKEYADALKQDTKLTGINYRKNIQKHIDENGVTDGMQRFINKVFEKVGAA